jgi:hypothetical protein
VSLAPEDPFAGRGSGRGSSKQFSAEVLPLLHHRHTVMSRLIGPRRLALCGSLCSQAGSLTPEAAVNTTFPRLALAQLAMACKHFPSPARPSRTALSITHELLTGYGEAWNRRESDLLSTTPIS